MRRSAFIGLLGGAVLVPTLTTIMGPRNMSPEVTAALRGAITRALASEEARAKLAAVADHA